VYTARFRLK